MKTLPVISFVMLFLLNTNLYSQSEEHQFWTSHSKYLDFVRYSNSCSIPEYDSFEEVSGGASSGYRATVVQTNDEVELYALTESDDSYEWKWEVTRKASLDSTMTIILLGDTTTVVLEKISALEDKLFETYAVKLFKQYQNGENELLDEDVIYVTAEKVGDSSVYTYNFDSENIQNPSETDDNGHLKVVYYPEFSSNASNSSGLGKVKEKVEDKCVYPAYYSDDTMGPSESQARKGDGCLHVFNPKISQITILDSLLIDGNCENYNSYETYDFCEDPCGFDAFTLSASDINQKNSITAKSQVNFYPNHPIDNDYYYALSIKIPYDFDETRLVESPSGAMGKDRWHILAEFHQSNWPVDIDELHIGCQASLQLLYLGESRIALQYGLKDFNRCAFGPWKVEKGEWFDVIFHIEWEQVSEPEGPWDSDEGQLEFWINAGDGYQKRCLVPATNFYRDHRGLGTKKSNYAYFTESSDYKTVYGPNLENFNPPYISIKSMRGASIGGTQGFDFQSDVFFDELRVAQTLEEVRISEVELIPDSLIDCYEIDFSKSLTRTNHPKDEWEVICYPNPITDGTAHIQFNGRWKSNESLKIEVFNMQGEKIFSDILTKENPDIKVRTDQWKKGIFILKAHHLGEIKTSLIQIR